MKIIISKIRVILILQIALLLLLSGCNNKKSIILETVREGNNSANCYILGDLRTGRAVIIDTSNNLAEVRDKLKAHNLVPEKILLTHGHFDHISGITKLKEIYPEIKVYVHQEDAELMANPQTNMSLPFLKEAITAKTDNVLRHGDEIRAGDLQIKVLHTPGHTPGSVAYQLDNMIFSGDTLLKGSVGRTDFPGGNQEDLFRSIKDKLLPNPDNTVIYPGHGEETTVGAERKFFQ